jgi:hypothetical protein
MAAIATIADAVPLSGENRVIAALGLRELRRPVGAGLRALFAAAALDPAAKQITGFDVAFRLAPRINAAGRMDVASEVIELFCTRDSCPRRRAGRQTRAPQPRAPRRRSRRAHRHRSPPRYRRRTRLTACWSSTAMAGIAASSASSPRASSSAPPSRPSSSASKTASPTAPAAPSTASAAQRHRKLRRSLHALRRPRLRRRLCLPATRCPELKRRLRFMPTSTSPRASPSACCAFTPSCRSTASRRCSPAGCASSSPRPRQPRAHLCRPHHEGSTPPRACSRPPRIMKIMGMEPTEA